MSNHTEKRNGAGMVVTGTCITRRPDPDRPGKFMQCDRPRSGSTWYCKECTEDWIAHREGNRAKSTGDGYQDRTPKPAPAPAMEKWTNFPGPVVGSGSGVPLVHSDRPRCETPGGGHDGRTPAWTTPDGKILYGARGVQLNEPGNVAHLDLIIDCAGMVKDPGKFVKAAPNRRFAALNRAGFPEVLRLDWPDMTAPVHVGIAFWRQLLGLLPKHTAVCCVGGHGRTGTALACLMVASGMDPDTAIRTVREKHCRRAIETAGQESYIRSLGRGSSDAE